MWEMRIEFPCFERSSAPRRCFRPVVATSLIPWATEACSNSHYIKTTIWHTTFPHVYKRRRLLLVLPPLWHRCEEPADEQGLLRGQGLRDGKTEEAAYVNLTQKMFF